MLVLFTSGWKTPVVRFTQDSCHSHQASNYPQIGVEWSTSPCSIAVTLQGSTEDTSECCTCMVRLLSWLQGSPHHFKVVANQTILELLWPLSKLPGCWFLQCVYLDLSVNYPAACCPPQQYGCGPRLYIRHKTFESISVDSSFHEV